MKEAVKNQHQEQADLMAVMTNIRHQYNFAVCQEKVNKAQRQVKALAR